MNGAEKKQPPKKLSPYHTRFGFVDFSIEARTRLKEGKQQ